MFSKILIANRGEIAIRIIRACKEMGISTVAVFSEADRDALHVSLADESYCIGPAPAAQSYLNMDAILMIARFCGVQAIHPGYGLLSENPEFAQRCEQAGIEFIGAPADVMRKMGDKDMARRTMRQAGVPVVPGCDLVATLEDAIREAKQIGYPLLIKARAGGGGRGIRRVNGESELAAAYRSAAAEAQSAFGDGALYMEKLLLRVKHIEVQLLCDRKGHVVCLGERDCSMQRKNQKVIEESPAVCVSGELRKQLTETTALAAREAGYVGAGTIEYLLTEDGQFYFMEMNTRLQVEHPVTEMVTGVDLVKSQIRIASGQPLTIRQKDVRIDHHAIECRINAEDPANNFRPSCGQIGILHIPGGPNVRFDTALYQGYSIPPFYDSMIGKLIVSARTREDAIRKMQAALCEMVIEGVNHNAQMHLDLLCEPVFIDGSYTTDYLANRKA
ncbi:MAG TPA: acetyl-CoA carboxylase biotin carboxylase subunit [Candidatus Limiplasma sp.]|nr:acetyl-CoA carboxylase biotin carboxylase subunit [Candidatus Limiplasma sp.]